MSILWRRAVLVDSSTFFALLDADDTNHALARITFEQLAGENRSLVSTNLLVAEVYALTQRRLGASVARAWLNALPTSQISLLHAGEVHHSRAVALINKYPSYSFSYADAVAFVIADERGIGTFFSFDRHFAQYAGISGRGVLGGSKG